MVQVITPEETLELQELGVDGVIEENREALTTTSLILYDENCEFVMSSEIVAVLLWVHDVGVWLNHPMLSATYESAKGRFCEYRVAFCTCVLDPDIIRKTDIGTPGFALPLIDCAEKEDSERSVEEQK